MPRAEREPRARGKLRGIGLANYIEGAGGFPRERAEVTVAPEGRVELVLGTMNSGQGHETSFAQLAHANGSACRSTASISSPTTPIACQRGGGSHSGRSMRIASLAIGRGVGRDHRQGQADRRAPARGRAPSTSNSPTASSRSRAPTARVGIFEVAKAAATRSDLPEDLRGKLDGIGDETVSVGAFPSGTHVCEVEIDPDTGEVQHRRAGPASTMSGSRSIRMILHGQTHGAAAQGIGQALMEQCYYERGSGQLLTALVHGLRHAARRFPAVVRLRADRGAGDQPPLRHPPGRRGRHDAGAGRGDQCRGRRAVGVRRQAIEMPATPERVWQAIRSARSGGAT